MANDLAQRAEDLFTHFVAPLVLGGELVPGRILGARKTLALGVERTVTNIDLAAHVDLARIRIARKIAPIDRIEPMTSQEWALAACLHDIVQSTHPALAGLFRKDASRRILELVNLALDRIPLCANAHDALSRHTIFSRALEIGRTDTHVSWWVGHETFHGTEPPPRLLTWSDIRRVHVDRSVHPLVDLRLKGNGIEEEPYFDTLRRWLSMSPITDLANAHRSEIPFVWSAPTLALVASPVGRTLAARAIRGAALQSKITAIDHATIHLQMQHPQAGAIARALVSELTFFNDAATHRNSCDELMGQLTGTRTSKAAILRTISSSSQPEQTSPEPAAAPRTRASSTSSSR